MSRLVREIRRAPLRILTSVLALALAVGAMGVFAIPTVSTSSLRAAAERDGVPDLILSTTPIDSPEVLERVAALEGVRAAEGQRHAVVDLAGGDGGADHVEVLGLDLAGQTMDVLQIESGRLPAAVGEVLVTPGTAAVGTTVSVVDAAGGVAEVRVVGEASTSFWSDTGLVFADLGQLGPLLGGAGSDAVALNRIVVRAVDDGSAALDAAVDDIRAALAADGVRLTEMPTQVVDGRHPIEADIEQVSTLIGLLGIVAGLVGLVLLASTTNTLIVERSREVAIMRALGAEDRAVRRRLRRIALGIAFAGVLIGLPLGIAISYVIARMVLQEFVGLTPGFAVSWPVLIGSAAFALVGARLVAARSARRVTGQPLAETLRDRDAVSFGRGRLDRLAVRLRAGRLTDRLAIRNGLRSRGRSAAIALQLGAAVAALLIVASMATTINAFNRAELDPIRWGSMTYVPGPGLDVDAGLADGDPRSETAILVEGETAGWQIDVYGWEPTTEMIDRTVTDGTWFDEPGEAVVSVGFADRTGVGVGDRIEVEVATGPTEFVVSGLHDNRGRNVYVARDELAGLLGGGDETLGANLLVSLDAVPAETPDGPTRSILFDDLDADTSGRQAILLVFGAIGLVVVSVAGLAVMSGLAVNLHERRHELAAMRSLGARRRDLFGVLITEVAVLGVAGLAIGLVAGFHGARAITESFEAADAVEIGFVFADGAIPATVAAIAALSVIVTLLMVRTVVRRPAAEILRSAS